MGQRLGIAAALLGDPRTLILDDPVDGLDPEGVQWVRQLVRALAAEGRTVFLSSHLMSEMSQTADHLLVIGRGRIIADGPCGCREPRHRLSSAPSPRHLVSAENPVTVPEQHLPEGRPQHHHPDESQHDRPLWPLDSSTRPLIIAAASRRQRHDFTQTQRGIVGAHDGHRHPRPASTRRTPVPRQLAISPGR
jgi:ABC-type multidrug transport system ATPase subunit